MSQGAVRVDEARWSEVPPRPPGAGVLGRIGRGSGGGPRLAATRPALRAAGRQTGRPWLRGPADPNAVLTLMLVPHSAATPWVWRIRARALHFAALSVAAISVVAILGVATARAEGGYLRLARGQLARLGGVRTAAAAQADAVDAQAAVLTQQAQELDALSAQVQALLSAQPAAAAAAGVPAMAGADQNLAQATAALQALSKELPRLQSQVAALGQEMASWSSAAAHTPSLWPVLGPITSPFGERPAPFGGEGQQFHDGVDIGVPTGTPVHATADGRVIAAGWDSIYGWQVRIDHGAGLQTLYGHNSRLLVAVGEQVVKGQVISLSGSTGASTGPHVHYEVDRYGTPVNPLQYLPGGG